MNDKFKQDLEVASMYEDYMIDILKEYDYYFVKKSDYTDKVERKEYDLMMEKNGKKITFEVKTDFFMTHTENEIFEHHCNNLISGILSTKSNFFVTLYPLEGIIRVYETQSLRNFILECIKGVSDVRNQIGGDGYRSKFILINRYKIYDMLKEYNVKHTTIKRDIPIFKPIELLIHFQNKSNGKYTKIIDKLKEYVVKHKISFIETKTSILKIK